MSNGVTIAGIFDRSVFPWGDEIFEFTVQRLRNDSRYSDLDYVLVDSACDETTAVRGYWDLRSQNNGIPVHGIVGARCSGASVSLARIAGLEQVNQVSPSSTSSRLSDKDEFPFFSRLLAPDDASGEVAALVTTLKWFGWNRVSILSTDTLYAKDYVNEFRRLWEGDNDGDIAYSNIIRLSVNGELDMESVDQALRQVPTDDPANNSRIILLIAQHQHAYPILKWASETGFQPDTVWVGTSSWIGEPPEGYEPSSWLGTKDPGYLGVGPAKDTNAISFLEDFNTWRGGSNQMEELPIFAAELTDSITALARALYNTPVDLRRNGYDVRQQLWNLDFEGASGRVRFTSTGDRRDPKYSISHLTHASSSWTTVGESGIDDGSTTVDLNSICWPTLGCSLTSIPSDSYPVPAVPLASWAIALIVVLLLLFLAVSVRYWRSRRSKQKIRQELEQFRDSVIGMRTAERLYVPFLGDGKTLKKRALPTTTVQWCWEETEQMMYQHKDEVVEGHRDDCWVKYGDDANAALESAFQAQGGAGFFSPLPGYVVEFSSMTQTKIQTGFERQVQRLVKSTTPFISDDETSVETGDTLPEEIKKEPQMVLVPGDVIQISKQKADSNWAFGTKLFHEDQEKANSIVKDFAASNSNGSTTGSTDDSEETNVFADTGWFQLDATRLPTTEDLEALKRNVGDTDVLNAPANWTTNNADAAEAAQVVRLKPGDAERANVERALKSSVGSKVKIASVSRIENLAMWQSYVVKRQTICHRKTGPIGQDDPSAAKAEMDQAINRYERCWLWHGTNSDVMNKILQQGFNRSFCGKNATVYGKGVYFARDSSYSKSPTYAVPDSKGYQYMMACRVAVGEYCPGVMNALTPDVLDHKTHTLYDSTIGLLGSDSMANPSIYVTYHDAQAYPEVRGLFGDIFHIVYHVNCSHAAVCFSSST